MSTDNKEKVTEVNETTVQKKISLVRGVWYDIETANGRNGFKDLRHMLTEYSKVGNMETMIEQRRNQKFKNDCVKLQTIANKIKAGIDKENNIHKFVKEMETVCADWK